MTRQLGQPLRQTFGETLVAIAAHDERILVLDADVGSSTGAAVFENAYPERYIQGGIAEQNMLGMAAGFATVGFVPFVTTFACFAVARALDSIRVLIAQTHLPVKVVGGYAGLLTGMTGKTHQILNDIAIMRTLPGMVVLAPADEEEVRQAVHALVGLEGPAYIQITREPSPILFGSDYEFQIGRAVLLRTGADVTLISTGVQTTRVLEAAELLAAQGIEAGVLHMPTIKPIDEEMLVDVAETTRLMITIEEQSVLGGLGGAVAEVLAARCPVHMERLGLQDCFGESGPDEALLEKYRLSARQVAQDVQSLVRSNDTDSRAARRLVRHGPKKAQ